MKNVFLVLHLIKVFLNLFNHHVQAEYHNMIARQNLCITCHYYTFTLTNQASDSGSLRQPGDLLPGVW